MKVGRGTEDGVQVGPLIDKNAVDKVSELVADALDKGARAVVGARPGDGRGYFYLPTVLADVPADARVLKEEIFGPVAPVAASTTRRPRSRPPTTPSSGWSPTSTPAT